MRLIRLSLWTGFVVAVASVGERALELVSQFEPDLVILDVLMPRLDGIAQSMLAGRDVVSDDLLARTAVGESDDASPPVPRSFAEVAEGLRQRRGVLEAGGVFPPHVIPLPAGTRP